MPCGPFDHACSTIATPKVSIPPKHTGRSLSIRPPFYGYALRPGITFTYLSLKVDEHAAALGGKPSPNVFAAGEMMSGNVLGKGYTAGVGIAIGTAFGRIAGAQAAQAARPDGAHYKAA